MTSKYPNIQELREAFAQGANITQYMREHQVSMGSDPADVPLNSVEAIEAAYDLQAGSYERYAIDHPSYQAAYAAAMFESCRQVFRAGDRVLDCGAGELTTLSAFSHYLPADIELLAFDISVSRIRVGNRYASRSMRNDLRSSLQTFVADMHRIPLAENSVDVVMTSHALEPNRGREAMLIRELIRVARRSVILFEPSYENNSDEGRARMDELGYVRGLPESIRSAGGELLSCSAVSTTQNPLNPTYCYVIGVSDHQPAQPSGFLCPRSACLLERKEGYWWSARGGWAYPEIEGVPCLREQFAVLMTHE